MPPSLLRIAALVVKELRAILADPRARIVLVVPPIVQCLVFGYAATYDLTHVPYALLDEDHGPSATLLASRIDGCGVFTRTATLANARDIAPVIERRQALVVVHVPPQCEATIASGGTGVVQLIADGRNSNTAATAIGYLDAIVAGVDATISAQQGRRPPPLTVLATAWYNPNLQTRWTMIPSLIGTLTLLQTLLVTSLSVAREREQGSLDQLLVAPFLPLEIMAGKALPSLLIGWGQAGLILVVARWWFGIPFHGSLVTLAIGLTCFLAAGIGIGLWISSRARSMQQAMLESFLVILPCTLLSGFATPVAAMPAAIEWLSRLNPLRYAIDLVRRVYLAGADLPSVAHDCWPLVVIAGITLWLSSRRFRQGVG